MGDGNGLAKVSLFEDQVTSWVLDHAAAFDSEGYALRERSGLAVLTLTLPYFEQIAGYLRGQDGPPLQSFLHGLVQVLPDLEQDLARDGIREPQTALIQVARVLYDEARAGLFHEAIVRGHVIVQRDTAPLRILLDDVTTEIASIVIDPFRLLDAVRAHLEQYVQRLRDPGETALRRNFERLWDQRMSASAVPPPSAAVSAPAAATSPPVAPPTPVSAPALVSAPAPLGTDGDPARPVLHRLMTLVRSRW
jgi:hypothetical protein